MKLFDNIKPGEDVTHTMQIIIVDAETGMETPQDLTGTKILLIARKRGSNINIINQTIDTHDDPTNGITTITLTGEDTKVLSPGRYDLEIWHTDQGGNDEPYYEQELIVEPTLRSYV